MQTTERPTNDPPARGTSPARGVVLVAVAVVLGFFVLRAIDDTGAGPVAVDIEAPADDAAEAPADDGDGDATEPAADGDGGEAPAEPEAEVRPPGEVVVAVANASGVQGAAAAQTDAIAAGGYQTGTAGNAPDSSDTTQVMAIPGFEAEAAVLAEAIGAPEGAVQPMSDPPPMEEVEGVHIVVVLGTDLAG
jgi:hypothetical protein